MIHEARVIPLDGRPAIGKQIEQDMGAARGRWDGDTLVVETTNFKERSVYRNANPATLKLTERFTRTAADKVRWAVTVDDPATWTTSWTFALPLTADPNPLPLYECHEGNYGLRNILSAARAEERAAEIGFRGQESGIRAGQGKRPAGWARASASEPFHKQTCHKPTLSQPTSSPTGGRISLTTYATKPDDRW